MTIAIVHDDLMRRGGAEQVVLSMLKAFPQADLYTMCYRPDLTYAEFKNYKITTSYFQPLARNEKFMKWLFFPFGLMAMKMLKLKEYDVVLISTTYCAKYIKIHPSSKVYIYTYTPFRLAWNPTSYKEYNKSTGLLRRMFNYVIKKLQVIDRNEAQKGNVFIAMTNETAQRIRDAYGIQNIHILYPPVKCYNFHINSSTEKKYFLLVSRLEFYKKVDLAIEAFNQLGLPLVIVGNGSKKKELMAMSNSNIEFKTGLSTVELANLYSNCKAFIFPQYEDYGITALEANASGRPVIAFGKGGVLETMINYNYHNEKATSIFFYEQNKQDLIKAILKLMQIKFDSQFIRSHALKFDEGIFIEKLKEILSS